MKKITGKCIVMLVTFAMLISALGNLSFSAAADSLIQNGDFENGTTGFIIEKGGYTGAKVETVTASDGGKMLSIETGDIAGSIHTFRVYQAVTVEPNTDYVWKLELGAGTQRDQYLGVIAGDTVKANGNTALPAEWQTVSGSITFNPNNINAGAQSNSDGTAADSNWLRFDAANGWNHVRITFNSGNNTKVCLAYGVRHTGRAIKTDNWSLYKKPAVGKLTNGDFNDGTSAFTNINTATFEVIKEPGNTENNVLHLIGGGSYYQQVSVAKNTDYIWTFRMKDIGNTGSTRILVNPENGTDNLITAISKSGSGYASLNDGTYSSVATYNKAWVTFTVKFNSGENENVRLLHNTWTTNREIYMDDWTLDRVALPGELRNGDFEDGLKYFTVDENTAAEVTKEDVYDGTYSAKVSGRDNTSKPAFGRFIYQEVTVKPDTNYIWSFWYKSKAHKTSLVGVRTADDSKLLPSFLKTDAYAVDSDRSFTEVRSASDINLWHETLYNTDWKQYNIIFNSGDNTSVRLSIDLINSARGGFTDNWTLGEYTFMRGDADNDGTVDSKDLVEIRRRILGSPSYYMGGIDVNEDGQFDIRDLIKLKKELAAMSPIEGYSLVWSDDFGGEYLDGSKWTRGEHMSGQEDLEIDYTDKSLSVADGSAVLYAGKNAVGSEKAYYTNASLTTCNTDASTHTMSFKYGYVEMRAKIPFGAPAFPSFWMKSVNENGAHGEIDIFEHFCYNGVTQIQSGAHKWYTDSENTHLLNNSIGVTDVAADGDWHTYGLLWTPEKLEFLLDGKAYHAIDISDNPGSYTKYTNSAPQGETVNGDNKIFHDYYYLIMNNYIYTPSGTNNADYAANSSSTLPTEYVIDYVRLYQNGDGALRTGALS